MAQNEAVPDAGNEKVYKVPEEIALQFDVYLGLEALRDSYISRILGYKKAKKLAIDAETAKRKAWQAIYELYPELKNKRLSYNMANGIREI